MQSQKPPITEETFVRHLPFSAVLNLASILDIDMLWERLAVIIPCNPDLFLTDLNEYYELRYSSTSIARISEKSRHRGGSCTKSLITDWGTQNCKIKHLIEGLSKAGLTSAADYLRHEVLQGNQANGPQQNVAFSDSIKNQNHGSVTSGTNSNSMSTSSENSIPRQMRELSINHQAQNRLLHLLSVDKLQGQEAGARKEVQTNTGSVHQSELTGSARVSMVSGGNKSDDLQGAACDKTQITATKELTTLSPDDEFSSLDVDQLKAIRYKVLQNITNNFDPQPYRKGGHLVGEGGFGKVYIGIFNNGFKIAIKCMNEDSDFSLSQFKTEVETLVKFKHENLVHLLGYSTDGEARCLVYQYMSEGSLEDRLACRYDTRPLSNNMRLEIARGTARGIVFLHKNAIIHRDIKTANILLDAEFNPKVGDFATARVAPSGMTTVLLKTSTVVGTTAYMAPEAMFFFIHPGLDTFSFGVVILELLTGLPVVDMKREDPDLKLHIQNHCCEGDDGEEAGTIFDLLDNTGGEWVEDTVNRLYSLSSNCLELDYKRRPKMPKVLQDLEQIGGSNAEEI